MLHFLYLLMLITSYNANILSSWDCKDEKDFKSQAAASQAPRFHVNPVDSDDERPNPIAPAAAGAGELAHMADFKFKSGKKSRADFAGNFPKQVSELITILKLSALQKSPVPLPKLVLLHGPSGTGKTTLVDVIANESKRNYIHLLGTHLFSKYIGEDTKKLQELFKRAKALKQPVIIFIDEIDQVLALDGSDEHNKHRKDLCDAFHFELQELPDDGSIICIGATNHYEKIEGYAKNRMRGWCIEIPLPTAEVRADIMKLYATKHKIIIADNDFARLVTISEGWSGREIEKALYQAFINASTRAEKWENPTPEELIKAFQDIALEIEQERNAEGLYTRTPYANIPTEELPPLNQVFFNNIPPLVTTTLAHLKQYKAQFPQAQQPLQRPLLLFGRPGNGKSVLAEHIKRDTQWNCVYANGTQMALAYQNKGIKGVERILGTISKESPTILLIEEIEKVIPFISQFINFPRLTPHIYIIGETNHFNQIDATIHNKFQTLEFNLKATDRSSVLDYYLLKNNLQIGELYEALVAATGEPLRHYKLQGAAYPAFGARDLQHIIEQTREAIAANVQPTNTPSFTFTISGLGLNPSVYGFDAIVNLFPTTLLWNYLCFSIVLSREEKLVYNFYENRRKQLIAEVGAPNNNIAASVVPAIVSQITSKK
jgi:AAA+ superfamily predicted ATPase